MLSIAAGENIPAAVVELGLCPVRQLVLQLCKLQFPLEQLHEQVGAGLDMMDLQQLLLLMQLGVQVAGIK